MEDRQSPFSPKCHSLSEKSKSSASGGGIARSSRATPGRPARLKGIAKPQPLEDTVAGIEYDLSRLRR